MRILARLRLVAAVVTLFVVIAACGGDDGAGETSTAEGSSGGEVELTVWGWNEIAGMEFLIEEYAEDHGITINSSNAEPADHHDRLASVTAAGAGGPDIALIETAYIEQYKASPASFVNLLELGSEEVEDVYLDWRWADSLTPDGEFQIGLPTDVGPMALAYRQDLFEEAGLPSEPADVEAATETWEDFIAFGEEFVDATGIAFIPETGVFFRVIAEQEPVLFFDPDTDEFIADTNPQVREAYDISVAAHEAGISQNVQTFGTDWAASISGDFAVQPSPAWMLQRLRDNAGESLGEWNIAQLPEGAANWGGSFLTVTQESEHPEEAYELISWLTAPEQQVRVFTSTGQFPSAPEVYDSEGILDHRDPLLREGVQPGVIFGEAAQNVTSSYYGPDGFMALSAFQDALTELESGSGSAEENWQGALDQIQRTIER